MIMEAPKINSTYLNELSEYEKNKQSQEPIVRYPYLDLFFSFIDNKEELNSVLCGYFGEIFPVILSHNSKDTFTYIAKNPQIFDNLIYHTNQPSICEVLVRILNSNTFLDGKLEQ
jgi:hypothetical protein